MKLLGRVETDRNKLLDQKEEEEEEISKLL